MTVKGVDDADTVNDMVTLTHAATSTDSDYDGFTIAGVDVMVEDNDTAKVTGVTLTPGDEELVVAWMTVANATGYQVQWKSGGQSYNNSGRQATIGSGSSASHTISSLTNGTTYTVRMRATRTGANAGPYSDEAMDAPQAGASTDATLSGLALADNNGAAIALTPTFATAAKSYTAKVENSVDSVTLTPTVNESNATFGYFDRDDVAIIDTDTTTSALDAPVAIRNNTFKVKVTAQDGDTTETYTVVVTRNSPATGRFSIQGIEQVGQGLSAQTDISVPTGWESNLDDIYQWIRVDGGTETDISSATGTATRWWRRTRARRSR